VTQGTSDTIDVCPLAELGEGETRLVEGSLGEVEAASRGTRPRHRGNQ